MAGLLGLGVLLTGLCATTGVRIINCNNNKVDIFEDSPAPVTCGDVTSTVDVVWRRRDGVNIGECKADGTCTTALYNDYRLRRSPQSTESQLTLVPDYRRHAGLTVTCQDTASLSTASCTLVIKRHSELSGCQVTTNTVDWTVSGSCRVQQSFSSDNIYTCSWKLNDGQQTFGGFDNNRERCSFTNEPLPQKEGVYTYTVVVFPPPTTGYSQTVRKAFNPRQVTTTPNVTRSASSSDSIKWIIARVVTAVVFLVILITAIYIKRRQLRCQDPVYDTPVPLTEDVHTYTGLQAGHSMNNNSQTLHCRSEDVDGDTVYENQGHEVQVHPNDSVFYYNSV